MDIIKKYWQVLLIGLILRVLISAFTYHPDARILSWTPRIILHDGQLNFYDFAISLNSSDSRYNTYKVEAVDDLPLHHWIRIPFDVLTRPLVDINIEQTYLEDASKLFGNPALWFHLALDKFQLVILDLILGVLIASNLVESQRRKALIFWILNPISLWAVAAVGQIDIIPTLFLFLSYLLFTKNRLNLAALSLGIGAAIKSFPFLIAPFLILLAKSWKQRFILAILSVLPFILSTLPYLSSHDFRANALFAPQLDKSLYAQIPLSGGEAVILSILVVVVLYLIYLSKPKKSDSYLVFLSTTLLLVLSLTHFHIQWFMWVTPFLVLLYFKGIDLSMRYSILVISLAVLMMLFCYDASLQLRLFSPLFPNLSNQAGLLETLKSEQLASLRSLAATLFMAGSLVFCGKLMWNHDR